MAELMYIKLFDRLSRQRILLHILFWIAVIIFHYFVFHFGTPLRILTTTLGFLPGHILFAYSLNYFLFPKFVLKGKLVPTIIGFAGILTCCLFYARFADVYLVHYSGERQMWRRNETPLSIYTPRTIYALFSTGWMAVTIKLVKSWYLEKQRQQQLEKEKLIVELQLLRSQLHPHFLFNTLNSLYSFCLEKSDQAPQLVLKLSALLRYILYECNPPLIPLTTEIDIIKNYLALESMRFGDRLDCSLQFTGDIAGKTIAPLLMLPFVENSIKHGISKQLDKSWISLHLHVEANTLTFQLINSRDEAGQRPADRHPGGLGLHNVQKRLELLYPGTHTLKCLADEDTWQVTLVIRLASSKEMNHHAMEMSHR
ncbi:sensor histidine kinase [Puia dinghuensis]|uniref:Histidine kinase n=1 Tax=Puia dinghuensis TaxID=1792502 RepID=A0A8J2UBW8_9BACT|nr:histidine kinase [Puia dinghuensis]GGA93852.1 histidine kinase [Puia dinghuensis]